MRKKPSASTEFASLQNEMAQPRVSASATAAMQGKKSRREIANVLARCRGIYKRVAEELDVDPSLVSRVVSGDRNSPEIDAALFRELRNLRASLDDYK